MKWEEESYTRRDENGNLVSLEEYEARQKHTGISRIMTRGDLKLYAICGVGFMLDAYDLFIVNLAAPVWQYEYFGGLANPQPDDIAIPTLLQGAVKASANIGNVVGQISFGLLGDTFGRKFVYGKELIIAMIGIILVISLPNSIEPAANKMWWIFAWRLVLGIGIGGDYPMSAAIVAERSTLRNRGRMLGWIFSNQGWGNLLGAIVTLVLLGCFHDPLSSGDYGKLDGVWRLQIGLALVPCAITLYFRLTMPESRKFLQSGELSSIKSASSSTTSVGSLDSVDAKKAGFNEKEDLQNMNEQERRASLIEATVQTPSNSTKFKAFGDYFSEWRHLKILIGTAFCWFLVDVSFYGVNLNQSVILSDIGFSEGSTEYTTLIKNAYGNLIISIAGYVPGYFFTIAFIEILGRKWIQIQGFLVTALLFGVIAGDFAHLGTGGLFVCFALAQFFFNFGANATTFIIPGEVFPSRVRGLAHGVSAAVGKLGAILAGVLFNWLVSTGNLGLPKTLWIFFALNVLGAIWTFIFVPETKGFDADAKDYEEVQEYLKARGVI